MFGANGKNSITVFIPFYKQCFNTLKSIVSTLSIIVLEFFLPKVSSSYLHKHKKWLRKIGLLPKMYRILWLFLQEYHIKKILNIFGWFVHLFMLFEIVYCRQNINPDFQVATLKCNVPL